MAAVVEADRRQAGQLYQPVPAVGEELFGDTGAGTRHLKPHGYRADQQPADDGTAQGPYGLATHPACPKEPGLDLQPVTYSESTTTDRPSHSRPSSPLQPRNTFCRAPARDRAIRVRTARVSDRMVWPLTSSSAKGVVVSSRWLATRHSTCCSTVVNCQSTVL